MNKLYTQSDRQNIAAAFRAAKERLWNGSDKCDFRVSPFICLALDPNAKGCPAVEIVMERLNGHHTIQDYLRSIGIEPEYHSAEVIQTFRHLWLDSLIKEFSA